MLEIIQSGGWMMVPIIIASILALAISVERFWTLRATNSPSGFVIPSMGMDEE